MDKINAYGYSKSPDYYGGGNRCLLMKVKKTMYTMKNDIKIVFSLLSNGTNCLKNDYYLSVKGDEINFQNLEKRTKLKAYCTHDDNYVYIYSSTPEYSYPVILQVIACSNYSLGHIEFKSWEKWSDTVKGVNITTSHISNTTPTNVTYTLANNWMEHTANNFSYVRQIDDMVYVNLTLKSGDVTDYNEVATGLPPRSKSEPTLLYPVTYKDNSTSSYKNGYCRLTVDGKIQILGVTDNHMLIIAFNYKRDIKF